MKNTSYSQPRRSALEAKNGTANKERGSIAAKAYICPIPPKPEISAVIAPEPNIKTGNINGNIINAVNTPPFPIAQDKAAGVAPIKVSDGVPNKSVNPNIHQYEKSKPIIKDKIGERITIGRPFVSQCAMHLDNTIVSSDIPDRAICSRDPSSKSDLNKRSKDNKEENKAATHIAPPAILVNKVASVPADKGNIIIANK